MSEGVSEEKHHPHELERELSDDGTGLLEKSKFLSICSLDE